MAVVINVVGNYDGRQLAKAERDLAALRKQAEITGTGIDTAFSKQSRAMRDFGSRISSTGRSLSEFGSSMTRNVTLPLVAVGGVAYKAIQAASDFAETQSKVGVIFGDQAKQIEDWSKTMATAFGQSQTEAMNAASTFAMFGSSAGLSGQNLVGFSTELTQLASDMASFNNTSPEEAITAIGAALRGEMEPIRKYNVLLNDQVLKEEARAMGIYKGNGALTAQQKILASSNLIFKQTTKQQGDFARTSGGLANQQRILQAELKNTTKDVGTALLPVALQIVNVIRDSVVPAITQFSNWLKTLSPQTIDLAVKIGMVVAAVGPLILIVGKLTSAIGGTISTIGTLIGITGKGVTALTAFGNGFANPASGMSAFAGKAQKAGAVVATSIGKMAGAVKTAMLTIGRALMANPWILVVAAVAAAVILIIRNWDKVKAFVISAWNAIKSAATTVWNAIVGVVTKAGELIWKAIQTYFAFYKKMGEFGLRLVQGLWEGINDAVGWVIEKIKGFGLSILDGIKSIFGIASPSKETTKIGKYLVEGIAKGMTDSSANAKVKESAKKVGKTTTDALKAAIENSKDVAKKVSDVAGKIKDALEDAIASLNDQIAAVADRVYDALDAVRQGAEDMVSAATDKASDMRYAFDDLSQRSSDFAASVRDSVRAFFSLRDATDPERGGSLLDNLRSQVQQATAFAGQIRRLRDLGLNQSSIDEIIGAGVAQGTQIAAAVLAGGATAITEINSLQAQLTASTQSLGDTLAQDRFGAELSKAKANLDNAVAALDAATRSRNAIVSQINSFRQQTDQILGKSTSALESLVAALQGGIGDTAKVIGQIIKEVEGSISSLTSLVKMRTELQDTLKKTTPSPSTTPIPVVRPEEVARLEAIARGATPGSAANFRAADQAATGRYLLNVQQGAVQINTSANPEDTAAAVSKALQKLAREARAL